MFQLRLKQRMLVLIGGSVLLVICGLVAYTTLLMRAEAIRSASELATMNSKRHAAQMEQRVDYAFSVARTVAYQFQGFEQIPLEQRRSVFDAQLIALFESNKQELVDIWSVWQANALDGRDAEFINKKPGHDATGQYVPAVSLGGLEAVIGYNEPGQDSWYATPMQTRKDFASEPYDFTYSSDNRTVTLLTLSVPVLKNNTPIAVVGTDINIKDLVHSVRTMHSDGTVSTLLTNTGTFLVAEGAENTTAGNATATIAQSPPAVQEAFAQAAKGATVSTVFVRPDSGKKEFIVYTPIRIG